MRAAGGLNRFYAQINRLTARPRVTTPTRSLRHQSFQQDVYRLPPWSTRVESLQRLGHPFKSCLCPSIAQQPTVQRTMLCCVLVAHYLLLLGINVNLEWETGVGMTSCLSSELSLDPSRDARRTWCTRTARQGTITRGNRKADSKAYLGNSEDIHSQCTAVGSQSALSYQGSETNVHRRFSAIPRLRGECRATQYYVQLFNLFSIEAELCPCGNHGARARQRLFLAAGRLGA